MLKSSRFKVAVSMIILALLSVSLMPASAQAFHRIFRYGIVSNLSWSADGLLSFQEGEASLYALLDHPWYTYYPTAQRLVTSNVWPRQPALTKQEEAYLRPYRDDAGQINTFIFPSPNGRFLVVPSELGNGIWIYDRQTGEMAETYARGGGDSLYSYNVVWNRPGTVFMTTTVSGYGGVGVVLSGYVSNFTKSVLDVTYRSPWDDINLTVDGVWHWPAELYGISDDGLHVLFKVYGVNDKSNMFFRLMRWNVDTNTGTPIGDFDGDKVRTAMFEDGDPDRVVVVSDRGVSRYTISNGHHQILNTQLDYDHMLDAVFSSDGRWLAVDRGTEGLYVFDLNSDFIGLKAQSYTDETSRLAESETIFPHLNIVNTGDWPLDLSKLKLRYFFNAGDDQPLHAVCWGAKVENGCQNVTISVVQPDREVTPMRVDTYIEVGFKAGILPAHAETGEVVVRVNKDDWSNFDWSSYDNSDNFTDDPYVPVYYDGKMVWGFEPYY